MASETLVVDVSREELHSVEPTVEAFETRGAFEVELRNHGRAVHVHCNVDDGLSRVATLSETNHFVETESSTRFRVEVADGQRPVSGSLRFVAAYGAQEAAVPVTVRDLASVPMGQRASVPPAETEGAASGMGSSGGPDLSGIVPGRDDAPVLAMAGVALLVAVLAMALANSTVVMLGVGAVLLGILVAVAVLLR
ncbi:DUF7524 family protein [Haloarchaeobius litoreus]|uniref:Uncharacterized protein n=1 Tax=Haloarchaeobius litoreus TaxID=755306 RepID=A0ABD6DGZ0_9EURY|nr:hypothetical protein [Haloarchaeobius litoreus]